MDSKKCTKCGEVKPLDDFYRDKHNKTGRKSDCKACNKIRTGRTIYRSPDGTAKECTKCGEIKPLGDFTPKKDSKDGRQPRCRVCLNADHLAWARANPEKRKEIKQRHYQSHKYDVMRTVGAWRAANQDKRAAAQRKWRAKNADRSRELTRRRRAKQKGNKVLVIVEKDVQRLYESCCYLCGSADRIEMDHSIPLARGGRHAIGNLIPLCRICNSSKSDKTLMEYKVWLQRTA